MSDRLTRSVWTSFMAGVTWEEVGSYSLTICSSGPAWLLLGVWKAAILTECKIFMNYQWYPIWLTGEQLLGLRASRGAASVRLRSARVCARTCFSRNTFVRSIQLDVRVGVSAGRDIRRNNCVFNFLFSRWWTIILEMIKKPVLSIRIRACQSHVGATGSRRRADVLKWKCGVYEEPLHLYIYVCWSLLRHIAASVCVRVCRPFAPTCVKITESRAALATVVW